MSDDLVKKLREKPMANSVKDFGAKGEGGSRAMSGIMRALEMAAGAALSDLSGRKGIGNELDQCDDDIKAEISKTVAAKAIESFLRALPVMLDYELHLPGKDEGPYPDFGAIADAVFEAWEGKNHG